MTTSYDYVFKTIVIGGQSGKSSIISEWNPSGSMKTIGVEMTPKLIILNDGKIAKLQVWDTQTRDPSNVNYKNFVVPYFVGCEGVLIVFDISNKQTFDDVRGYIQDFNNACPNAIKILVGNKADLDQKRDVDSSDVQSLTNEFGMKYLEVSAKSYPNGVDKLFKDFTQLIDDKRASILSKQE